VSRTGAWLLALDTATTTVLVAAGTPDGRLLDTETFEGRYRHSQELLPAIARLMDRARLRLPDLAGIVVGTGPGAFTGLRVGLATAKTLAHELHRPVVGIETSAALLASADPAESSPALTVWLPSGPRDRIAVRRGEDPVVAGAEAVEAGADIAVDLDGRASEAALARGRAAIERLPSTLLALGAARLAAGEHDDPERLVPRYAVAPRGAPGPDSEGGVTWSRDPR
jgi:tRNA threonylcarbamoyl adenosine modification protein YeaZ